MRRRLVAILLALMLMAGMVAALAAPAGAYYGQVGQTWNFSVGGSYQGCYYEIKVYQGRRAQMYCGFKDPGSGSVYYKTDFVEYYCPYYGGCSFTGYISPWGNGWYFPKLISAMNHDDYAGTAAWINWANPQ